MLTCDVAVQAGRPCVCVGGLSRSGEQSATVNLHSFFQLLVSPSFSFLLFVRQEHFSRRPSSFLLLIFFPFPCLRLEIRSTRGIFRTVLIANSLRLFAAELDRPKLTEEDIKNIKEVRFSTFQFEISIESLWGSLFGSLFSSFF